MRETSEAFEQILQGALIAFTQHAKPAKVSTLIQAVEERALYLKKVKEYRLVLKCVCK